MMVNVCDGCLRTAQAALTILDDTKANEAERRIATDVLAQSLAWLRTEESRAEAG